MPYDLEVFKSNRFQESVEISNFPLIFDEKVLEYKTKKSNQSNLKTVVSEKICHFARPPNIFSYNVIGDQKYQ